MKNKLFQILIPLAVLFIVVGSLLKIMHWPGAFPIIYTGNGLFLLFIILYLTGTIQADSVPEFFKKSIPIGFFSVGIGVSIIGIIMKIMHWPFANISIIFGSGIMITACLIWMMNSLKQSGDNEKSQGQE